MKPSVISALSSSSSSFFESNHQNIIMIHLQSIRMRLPNRLLHRLLSIDKMEQHIQMKLVAHQLRTHFLHILLSILVRVAQDPRKQSQGIRFHNLQDGKSAHTANLFQSTILRPTSNRTLSPVSPAPHPQGKKNKPYKYHPEHSQTPPPPTSPQS